MAYFGELSREDPHYNVFHIHERLIDYKRNAFLRGCNSRYHLSSDEAKIKKHLFTELFNESFFSLKVEITGAISREKRG